MDDPSRIKQLRQLALDLRCWEVRRWAVVGGWTVNGIVLPPGAVWAKQRRLYRVECPSVAVPDDWSAGETYLEIGAFGYGSLRLTAADGRTSTWPVNEYSRRFGLPGSDCAVHATVAPIRDRRVGLATTGDRWMARLIQIEPDLDTFCRTIDAICGVATAGQSCREDLLRLAEAAVAAVEWPSASANFVSRVSHRENHPRHWFDVPADTHPEPLTGRQRGSLRAAAATLAHELWERKDADRTPGSVKLIGYAHTDLDWLWPEAVSLPAVIGQFAGTLAQLHRFPGYRAGQAGSYLYSLLEQHAPEVFADLVAAVAGGSWELLTGMWVEPDANMLSGESLCRQLLHGQAYFQSRFGRRSEVCWLPDTFGFSGALPQILAGAGIRYFFTTRLSKTEVRPHHDNLFEWEGIDGTRVLAFASASPGGYQCVPSVQSVTAAWQVYADDGVYPHALQPLGYANGIGPTDNDLADARVLATVPGLPATAFTTAQSYFADAERHTRHKALPVWRGELYMEAFRGTFTTQGRTKVSHRRAESALIVAEVVSALRTLRTGAPPEDLSGVWRRLLTRQTHDIVSGTCAGEVHQAAEGEFAAIATEAHAVAGRAMADIGADLAGAAPGPGLLFVNPTMSWRTVRAVLPAGQPVAGGSVLASGIRVPPLGAVWGSAWESPGVAASGSAIENELVRVEIADDGSIRSVYDRRQGREMLAGPANVLRAYLDRPHYWDAWELADNYHRYPLEPLACTGVEVTESGPYRAAVRVGWRFRDSRVEQDIQLWAGSARIDVATRIDWHERRVLLRAYVPTAVTSDHATCECAYGVTRRPTAADSAWDRIRFEVPAHRFVDVSDSAGGMALLNDGRYGHHVDGGALSMSLLRSPVFPDPFADEGVHEFRYALYPHPGDWLSGGVLAEAADLNCPMPVVPAAAAGSGTWQPVRLSGLPLALGTFKAGERSTGLVLRAYEPAGGRGNVDLELPVGWAVRAELNLLEDVTGAPGFHFGPYQIRTWSIDRVEA
jgi:alpha-mannosidase